MLLTIAAATASAEPARYVDSDEAKDPAYNRSCAISDYTGLVETETLKWVWVDPSVRLASYDKIEILPVKNKSDTTDPEICKKTEEAFRAAFERIGKTVGPGGLKMNACIYWMQRASGARAMIPYGGFYLAQAGVGLEGVITDTSGRPIAKFRHDGREGGATENASYELVDEIANFVRDN